MIIFDIILDKQLFEELSYTEYEWDDLKSINKIRNRIAHPSKSLLDKDNDIQKLYTILNKIEDLNFRLKAFENKIVVKT
ncbi:MAG: hypothetical protein IPJ13_26405 [Saprospiraceae bacterium]|nr:hypothetical protein [Saprospiraceae bacterium]